MTQQEQIGNSDASSAAVQGYSGKVVVPILAGTLVISLVCMVFGFNAVSALEASQEEIEASWQAAATDLSDRYKQAELAIAKSANAGQIDIAFSEKFTTALERFRSTTRPFDQSAAAQGIESLLADFDASVVGGASPAKPWQLTGAFNSSEAIASYNATLEDAERNRERSIMQNLVCQVINFPLPTKVSVASKPAESSSP